VPAQRGGTAAAAVAAWDPFQSNPGRSKSSAPAPRPAQRTNSSANVISDLSPTSMGLQQAAPQMRSSSDNHHQQQRHYQQQQQQQQRQQRRSSTGGFNANNFSLDPFS